MESHYSAAAGLRRTTDCLHPTRVTKTLSMVQFSDGEKKCSRVSDWEKKGSRVSGRERGSRVRDVGKVLA